MLQPSREASISSERLASVGKEVPMAPAGPDQAAAAPQAHVQQHSGLEAPLSSADAVAPTSSLEPGRDTAAGALLRRFQKLDHTVVSQRTAMKRQSRCSRSDACAGVSNGGVGAADHDEARASSNGTAGTSERHDAANGDVLEPAPNSLTVRVHAPEHNDGQDAADRSAEGFPARTGEMSQQLTKISLVIPRL